MDKKIWTGHYPNSEGWQRSEGEAYIKTNKDGLLGPEHPKPKPASTTRIAVMGDSFTEAFQVPVEKTFWRIMESKLNIRRSLGGKKLK